MQSRLIRIFISSTFRDFGRERDLLAREVFPELRKRARERRVEIAGIDLRWGITEEESARGETLPICLAEIDRSRPYFIEVGSPYFTANTSDSCSCSVISYSYNLGTYFKKTIITRI